MKKVILIVTVLFLTAKMLTAQVPVEVAKHNRAKGLAMTLIDYPVNFTSGTVEMDAASKANLRKIAEEFKKFPNGTIIEIGANTTDLGGEQTNLEITAKRANAVKDELIALGVNPKALTAKGYGTQRPAYKPDNSETGRKVNTYLLFTVSPQSFKEDFEVFSGSGTSTEKPKRSSPNSGAASPALLADDYIRLNKGWKKVVLGASEQEIKNALGKPSFTYLDILDDPKNIWRYDEPGLIVWFKKEKESKAVKILFFAGAKPDQTDNTESFLVSGSESKIKLKKVPFAPEKVAWWASVEQVIAAYGKPDSQNKFDLLGSSVTLLKYGETNFYFRGGELYQIALISQDY